MAEDKKVAVKTGWVEIEFTKDFGSYKKGDKATYHNSTIAKLVVDKTGVAKVTKEITKYVPAKAVI